MKRLLFLFLFLQVAFCYAQHFAVANLKENIATIGIDNPLSASVADYPCRAVVLTTNNGKIEKAGCGYFIYRPAELGTVAIKVWIRNGKKLKLIGTVPYRVHSLPPPVAFIGGSRGGLISTEKLKIMGGIIAKLVNTDINASFQILMFTATANRDTSQVFTTQNVGARWNEELLKKFGNLKTGDHLLFSNIDCIGPNGKEIQLQPLEFVIRS